VYFSCYHIQDSANEAYMEYHAGLCCTWFTTCIQVIQQNWQDSVDSGHLSAGHLIDCVVTILCLAKTACQLTLLVVQTDLQSLCLYGLISLLVYIVIYLYLIEFSSYCTYHSHFSCYKSSQMEQLRAAIQGSSILYCWWWLLVWQLINHVRCKCII